MNRLIEIIKKLRAPDGCAWDRKQGKADIARYLLEEAYELLDAIAEGNRGNEREEAGDVLFLLLFLIQIADECGQYNVDTVIKEAAEKMTRRHPHVFGDLSVEDVEKIKANWRAIKLQEKGMEALPALEKPPRSMPQLARAQKVQEKAASFNFDWNDVEGVIKKLEEEINELRHSLSTGGKVQEEIGDILFSAVNLARFLGMDAEQASAGGTEKFIRRFNEMEAVIKERGQGLKEVDPAMMNEVWDAIKEREK